jgi:hypothetical protein
MRRTIIIAAACIVTIAAGYFIFTIQQRVVEKFDTINSQLAALDSSATSKLTDSTDLPLVLQQDRSLFVGAQQTDSMKLICGIEIKTINPVSFEYTIDFMNDWKKFKTIKGTAFYVSSGNNYQMKDAHTDKEIAADKFADIKNNLAIEISNQDLTSSIARVKKFIGKDAELTPVMFYK